MIRPPLALLALALSIATAIPARADNWSDCAGDDAELAQKACARIISVRVQVKDRAKLAVAYANRGRARASTGGCAAALADFAEALRLDAGSRLALRGRGQCQLDAGRVNEARADFEAALAIDGRDLAALVGRGLAAERSGDLAQARRDFAAALRIAPANRSEESQLSLARERLRAIGGGGSVVGAGEESGKGFAPPPRRKPARPGPAPSPGEWAACEAMSGPKSIAACSRIIDGDPNHAHKGLLALAHHFRGRAAFFIGDQIAAAEDLQLSARLAGDLALAFHERGRGYLAQREPQLALKDFDEALKRKPAFAAALRDKARAMLSLGRPDQALAEVDALLRADAGDGLSLILRGLAWQAKGELVRARADIERGFSRELGPGADPDLIAAGRNALIVLAGGGPGGVAARPLGQLSPDLSRVPADALWNECRSDAAEASLKACAAILRQGAVLSDELRAFALYRSAVAHGKAGRFDAAIGDYDAALRFMPTFLNAYIDRGIAWGRKGDNQRALADFERANELKPDEARIHLNRGVALERLKQFDRALADYTVALRLQPGYVIALLNRGLLFKLRGEAASARSDLEAVVAAPAANAEVQLLQERARQALAALPALAAAAPPSAAEIADCRSSDAEKALAACSAIIARGKTADVSIFAEMHRRRAIAWRTKGNFDQSLADVNQAIALAPHVADNYLSRGLTFERKGDIARAIEDYTEAIRRNGELALAWSNRGGLHFKRAEWQAAISDYTQAIRVSPKDPIPFVNRGVAHSRLKNYQAAIDDYTSAIANKADYALAWSNRSMAYMSLGNLEAALADANEAIRLRPTYLNALVHRGDLFSRRGDIARARADLEAALALRPSNDEEAQRQNRAKELLAKLEPAPAGGSAPPGPIGGAATGAGGDSAHGGGSAGPGGVSKADGLRRVALVIGNAAYMNAPQLEHPAIDAREFASALKRLGFNEIIERRDMTRADIEGELKAFGDLAAEADWAVVYVSGYGIQMGGRNYILPTDARIERPAHIEDEGIPLDRFLAKAREARGLRLVIVDACRENPFQTRLNLAKASPPISAGLAPVSPGPNEIVAACAGPGQVVSDGTQRHSPFTFALLAHLEQGYELSRLLEVVRGDVGRALNTGAAPVVYGRVPATGLILRPAAP